MQTVYWTHAGHEHRTSSVYTKQLFGHVGPLCATQKTIICIYMIQMYVVCIGYTCISVYYGLYIHIYFVLCVDKNARVYIYICYIFYILYIVYIYIIYY